jgi:proteasome assembly chaperone (PAC2) family protein
MNVNGFHIHELPKLNHPVLIAGFTGWGNALQLSSAMAVYIVHQLKARKFAEIDPDIYFRYDDMRPRVRIEDGVLKNLEMPEGKFWVVQNEQNNSDIVILKADEPNLRWRGFVNEFFGLCTMLNIRTIITLGSMFDHVLHTDKLISAIVSGEESASLLKGKGVNSISYQGPGAIHAFIHSEGIKRGLNCISLWCHCPFYMQGTTHYGLLAHLGKLLASLGGFALNVGDLEKGWEQQHEKIEDLIINNPKLKSLTDDLLKVKKRGMANQIKDAMKSDEKIINLKDFLNPK